MRLLLCILSLLLVTNANCQTLTLDQLVSLYDKDGADIDAYLVKRGWQVATLEPQPDSIIYEVWIYLDSSGRRVAELGVKQVADEARTLTYMTPTRPAYEAIRGKITAYHMEFLGLFNAAEGAWRVYRGNRFDAALNYRNIDRDNYRTWYSVQMQKHGLVKGFTQGENGKMEAVWLDPSNIHISDEMRQQLDVLQQRADSLNRVDSSH